MKFDPMSRRSWLCGVGGATLAIPFLPSLLSSPANAQSARPLNFVFVGGMYGRDIKRWYPTQEALEDKNGVRALELSKVDTAGVVSPILGEAFNELRDKFSLVRGLDGMQIEGDGHSPTFALTGSGSVNGQLGFGYSVDAVLEESDKVYASTPVLGALRACPTPTGNALSFSYSSRSGTTQRLSYDTSPAETYSKVFEPRRIVQREEMAHRQQPVANAVNDEIRSLLASGKISSDDRLKLDAHLSTLSDIEQSLGVSTPNCNVTEPAPYNSADVMHETAMDLAIAALTCGLTRVITHSITHHDTELVPNDPEAHSGAHNGKSRPEESGRDAIDQWVMNRWTMERVARFIKKLDAVATDQGTLLDDTVFVYGNVESRGFHLFYDMPVLVAGAPDKFQLGYYLDYRPNPLKLHNPALDVYAGRPYNHLLITLLKAMGLEEADYEKFGGRGFGVYDRFDSKALADHYRPFLSDRNATLPFLYRG